MFFKNLKYYKIESQKGKIEKKKYEISLTNF